MNDLQTAAFDDLPRGHYSTILADPPWSFRSWSDKGRDRCPDATVRQKGLSERHYAVMSLDRIRALPVGDLAAKRSALFLWGIDCMLPDMFDIGQAWGFTYKTRAFTWVKTNRTKPGFSIGLGYWTRGGTESCWLFTRGAPSRQSASVREVIVAHRREHSRKPVEAYERIEEMLPGPYLELFAREPRPGWDAWGNQLTRFDTAAE